MSTPVTLNVLIDEARQLDTPQLDSLFDEVRMLRAQRRVPHASQRETELLRHINHSLPDAEQQRFDELVDKRRAGTLAETEQTELLQLIEKTERLDAKRVKYLSQLAQLRGVGLRALMEQLGVHPPAVI